MNQNRSFTSIVLSGGAMKVLCSVGCVMYMEKNHMIDGLKNFVGTSAGSILCFLMVLGYKAKDTISFLKENLQDPRISTLDMEQVFDIITEYGISDGSNIVELVSRALHGKTRLNDITFMELAKLTGKNLVVCTSNLTQEKEEFFCIDTTPDMSVLLAIKASCAIPFVFRPVIIKDCYYLDGALYNNFPMSYFKDTHTLRDIIGINIIENDYQQVDNIISYTLFMVMSVINKGYKTYTNSYNNHEKNIVTLDIHRPDWLSISSMQIKFPSETELETILDTGYQAMSTRFGSSTRSVEADRPSEQP